MPANIISMHVPKAAGTSLRLQLMQSFGDTLELDYLSPPLGCNPDLARDRLSPGKRIVHGHFPAKRYAAVPDAFRMAFLRHPVDNLISIYFYWKKLPEHGIPIHTKFLEEQPTIDLFARYPGICDLISEQYFGDFDINLMSFVGFYHRRDSDLLRLSELLGVSLSGGTYENKTNCFEHDRNLILENSRITQELQSALKNDIVLYDKLLERFS